MTEEKLSVWSGEEGLSALEGMGRLGLSDIEISEIIGIKRSQYKKLKEKEPKITEAVERGRAGADFRVVNSLFKKATGYTQKYVKPYKLKVIEYDTDSNRKASEREVIEFCEESEYIPPDLKAIIFWLSSRMPELWSEGKGISNDEGDACGVILMPEVIEERKDEE